MGHYVVSINGQRAFTNQVVVDGASNMWQFYGKQASTFSQDWIQEFQVLTNSFVPEFGTASGGIMNVITRSGRTPGGVLSGRRSGRLVSRIGQGLVHKLGSSVTRRKAPRSPERSCRLIVLFSQDGKVSGTLPAHGSHVERTIVRGPIEASGAGTEIAVERRQRFVSNIPKRYNLNEPITIGWRLGGKGH